MNYIDRKLKKKRQNTFETRQYFVDKNIAIYNIKYDLELVRAKNDKLQ